ncbi:HNH endonuclease [Aetokthonos hydrillicola Thurmond2011]|jgi:predicted HNH restriction endonuclease|uniref:HNH endonuclease n=1 Tax=Aetokthonos hydrillicola Thurmond2011 TaxID=2712845 RepID=A0AAP5MC84_9CYAN|nr:HNH endonuclease [Aetokthonos hydrillicola]MBO3461564.1 HNH endonuclease [Aetokthonos hydrillicola CCALA 1050]MBW4586134.1 HNH endonuclease [Aetokthonos hydrillicola CCALA 1050]MDR9897739.1 HNH endonuclease [Aetokthonos hydrillicola Thurmond2011]
MPIYRERYADNWQDIARQVKESAGWKCQHCGQQCLRPGEKPKQMTRAEWTMLTLSVHHSNFTPEDNRRENLIPLCSPCHIKIHARGRSNTSPGQLELPI